MAVSIWEGNKAQELIDAIKQTDKVDVQQGTGNAGKTLVVGNDGEIVPTYTILPDDVKLALMDCFEHVMWDSEEGETTYGNALRDALYNYSPEPTPVDDRIIYEVLSADAYNRISNTHTGVELIGLDKDFTIIIKGLYCVYPGGLIIMNGQATSGVFLRIQTNYDSTNKTVAFRSTIKNVGGNTSAFSAEENHEILLVTRNDASSGITTIKTYVDGDKSYEYNNSVTSGLVQSGDYMIGGGTGTTVKFPFPGAIDIFRIYNVALSNEEIEDITGIDISL